MLDFTAFEPLFSEIQLSGYFSDSKTFPDCTPKRPLDEINTDFNKTKDNSEFSLKDFIAQNFDLPINPISDFEVNLNDNPTQHANKLWVALSRQADLASYSSLIPLPHNFVVPGGRFGEIYYWDSYFTMLGLRVSNRQDLIENMVDNFNYLIKTFGFIPNGNRTYFLSRSQPPFFSLMVNLLAEINGNQILEKYIVSLEKEYEFWMRGYETLQIGEASERVYCYAKDNFLNRYYDNDPRPRPESYAEDVELAHMSTQTGESLYTNLRAACESGWDFSSRWLTDSNDLSTINTIDILPVDLNCLLWNSENTLFNYYKTRDIIKAEIFNKRASDRKELINSIFWNESIGIFSDYNLKLKTQSNHITAAGSYPLFFKLSTSNFAEKTVETLEINLLSKGGILTTKLNSGQQWDAPNGWAPLEWMAYKGVTNYGYSSLANTIKSRWLATNEAIFEKEHKFTEKYDVSQSGKNAKGGEYQNQDGFGWTNGVYLAMKTE
jgi:alpha,alpha-trehalase